MKTKGARKYGNLFYEIPMNLFFLTFSLIFTVFRAHIMWKVVEISCPKIHTFLFGDTARAVMVTGRGGGAVNSISRDPCLKTPTIRPSCEGGGGVKRRKFRWRILAKIRNIENLWNKKKTNSTLLADNTQGLTTTKQTKPRPVAYSTASHWEVGCEIDQTQNQPI